jgi:aspartyl-tRNA(Asn)/glutamyl-tRNA(Gln) amidotransferase subunit C
MAEPLSRAEVERVALLARLKLTPAQLELFTSQLQRVLGYVDILNELDTEDIEPMAHAVERVNVFRDDVIQPSLSREDALANAPKTDGKSFLVPPILENT